MKKNKMARLPSLKTVLDHASRGMQDDAYLFESPFASTDRDEDAASNEGPSVTKRAPGGSARRLERVRSQAR